LPNFTLSSKHVMVMSFDSIFWQRERWNNLIVVFPR
jgi:hypothetical protein